MVEEFDDGYYATFRALAAAVRDEPMLGRRHVLEAESSSADAPMGAPATKRRPREILTARRRFDDEWIRYPDEVGVAPHPVTELRHVTFGQMNSNR
jgi:hypothetical protein